jgi:hypothetical protein
VDGAPSLTSNQTNSIGFADLPRRSILSQPNAITEITANLGSNVADATQVPQMRLRVSSDRFERVTNLDIASQGDGRFSPTSALPLKHRIYFAPNNSLGTDFISPSLDLINATPTDDPLGQVRLEGIHARNIPLRSMRVAENLLTEDFIADNHGWTSGGAPPFTEPQMRWNARRGSLEVTPTDHNSFGFWNRRLPVDAQGGALYRGRFLVSSESPDPQRVPVIRPRLNLSSFQLGATTWITSTTPHADAPTQTPRVYDVYLHVPADPQPGEGLRAAFDVLNFQEDDDVYQPINLENFTLERIEILD